MALWQAISNKFPRGRRRTAEAVATLTGAYQRVFNGKGSQSDAQIVLADLANYTSFYTVAPAGPDTDLHFFNGKRAAFLRILNFLGKSDEVLTDLQKAAMTELAADYDEGEII